MILHCSRQRWIPIQRTTLFSYGKVLAALTSRALRIVILLGAVELGYNTLLLDTGTEVLKVRKSYQQLSRTFLSDMLYIRLRGRRCSIIVLNAHAQIRLKGMIQRAASTRN
jgi:hypothetical protein